LEKGIKTRIYIVKMTQNKDITNFIKYLDNYKEQTKLPYSSYTEIIDNINTHYKNNQYSSSQYIGKGSLNQPLKSPRKKKNNKQPFLNAYNPAVDYSMFYSMYNTSLWNNTTNNALPNTCTLSCCIPEPVIPLPPLIQPSPTIKMHKKHIDASVSKLTDLLDIINNNDYNEDTEYNIDLKALHNIKDELTQLNGLIGLAQFKNSIVDQILYFVQNLHVGVEHDFKHTVIYGPPGTGKTEIAKIMGKMYSKIGILKNNVFKKVTRNDLIAGYLGQTAIKTKKVITESLGGCLFIDEAYSLANHDTNDSYSKECIDTICEALSDHKAELMVIVAGYEEEMNETFFKVNQGLSSRFIWRFKVDDYNSKELLAIFKKKVGENEWVFDCEAKACEKWFEQKIGEFTFFGRDMELLFSYTKISHGRRIYGKTDDLRKKITMVDLENGYLLFVKNTKIKKESRCIPGLYI